MVEEEEEEAEEKEKGVGYEDENRRSATGRNEVFSSAVVKKKVRKKHLVPSQHTQMCFSDISTHRHLALVNK